MSASHIVLLSLLCSAVRADDTTEAPPFHCANAHGFIAGLAADDHYRVIPPADGPPNGQNPERWQKVQDPGIKGSFTGSYMQVLPDDRDSYNDIHGGNSFRMTGLEFRIRVYHPGLHTLFLRWTGGDTVGGGDSLYVVLYDAEDQLVSGPPTMRPKVRSVCDRNGAGVDIYAGCCYSMVTHTCDCRETGTVTYNESGPTDDPACAYWVDGQTACVRYGVECEAGHGELELTQNPTWYLFAGQEYGNVMDFASEPWDATCEANGLGSADTGLDFAQWDLAAGDYRLVFYPREDGTALDAFYLATPANPPNSLKPPPADYAMQLGTSTVSGCEAAPSSSGSDEGSASGAASGIDGGGVFGLMLLGALLGTLGCSLWVRYQLKAGRSPFPFGKAPAPTPRVNEFPTQNLVPGAGVAGPIPAYNAPTVPLPSTGTPRL